jgi:hypothetical protein
MADTPAPAPTGGDPARPRYLGLWVAGILFVVLFGGAGGVVADVIYRLIMER